MSINPSDVRNAQESLEGQLGLRLSCGADQPRWIASQLVPRSYGESRIPYTIHLFAVSNEEQPDIIYAMRAWCGEWVLVSQADRVDV